MTDVGRHTWGLQRKFEGALLCLHDKDCRIWRYRRGTPTFGNKAALVSKAVYFRCKLGRSSGSVELDELPAEVNPV